MKATRRTFFMAGGTAALGSVLSTGIAARGLSGSSPGRTDGLDLVDPMIGTGGHGHTYPGATRPFGMVQLSPDTDTARWDACSGYHHDDRSILGFSHTHLSGTGVGDMLDVLVVPRSGLDVVLEPGTPTRIEGSYRQRFDHADERAEPGYYAVRLAAGGIMAELTVTDRAGLHRYRFSGSGHLLIDLCHGARDEPDPASIDADPPRPTKVTGANLTLIGRDLLVGSRRVHQWADGREIHFAMRLSRPFTQARLFSDDRELPAGSDRAEGASLKCALLFPDAASAPLLAKVGLSGVDVAGAIRNLDAEIPDWSFERVRSNARTAWSTALQAIQVTGGSSVERRVFHSAIYHALLAPTLFSDVDGRYRGMDTAIHTLPAGEHNYSTYSLWDTYRALHPLLSLIAPKRNADLVRGLIRMAGERPAAPPVWPLQGIETHCMIGWHSLVVIAEAVTKGMPGIDCKALWPMLRRFAFEDRGAGLEPYRRLGYIPSDQVKEAASKTLEYAYDDWALARIADAAGAEADATHLRARSRNYRNLFDPAVGFMRPRLANGEWAEPFDPRSLGHDTVRWRDFTECNAWQATFVNQHDVYGLIDLFGGDRAFEAKLDQLFTTDSSLPADAPQDMSGLIGQYVHGNEPSHHIAYLYAYCGAAWKTQARVRMLMATQYHDGPDGLAGNEDCGQMSAWYVFSALGLYPVDPVSGIYVFGSPLFPRAELALENGRTLVIEAPGVSPETVYIRKVTWNGKPWLRSWIDHATLRQGGRLVFTMGREPDHAFGRDPANRPPSFVVTSSA